MLEATQTSSSSSSSSSTPHLSLAVVQRIRRGGWRDLLGVELGLEDPHKAHRLALDKHLVCSKPPVPLRPEMRGTRALFRG